MKNHMMKIRHHHCETLRMEMNPKLLLNCPVVVVFVVDRLLLAPLAVAYSRNRGLA